MQVLIDTRRLSHCKSYKVTCESRNTVTPYAQFVCCEKNEGRFADRIELNRATHLARSLAKKC